MTQAALQRTHVLVMHHDPLLSAGLVAALRRDPAFETLLDDDIAGSDGPAIDVVITDYQRAMQLADPAVRAARRPLATARILALTSSDREADIRRAIAAGIHGYLLVGGPLDELTEGVATVAGGKRYLSRAAAQRVADSLTRASLTCREMEVLQLVVNGESNKAIARHLHIEVGTVKSHMSAIMAKLDATSRTQAAGIAASRGLVDGHAAARPAPSHLPAALPAHVGQTQSRLQIA
jgi:DNA-binding NarL/FixJ family response regulator